MTRRTCFFLLPCILIGAAVNCGYHVKHYYRYEQQQRGIIHPLIGETLDAAERARYGLLNGFENFQQAEYYRLADGGYMIEISTDDGRCIAVNRDKYGADILYDYIERFDEIQDDRENFEKKWRIVDYDDLGQPITISEISKLGNPATWALAAPGAFIGFVGGELLGFYILNQQEEPGTDHILALGTAMAGGCIMALPGAYFGSKIDKKKGAKALKEARKPRIMQ